MEKEKAPDGERTACQHNEVLKAAILHYGETNEEVLDSLIVQNVTRGTRGGFEINGMRVSPHNYGEANTRHRIIIDYDSGYSHALLRIVKVAP